MPFALVNPNGKSAAGSVPAAGDVFCAPMEGNESSDWPLRWLIKRVLPPLAAVIGAGRGHCSENGCGWDAGSGSDKPAWRCWLGIGA
jgi:hypothetical protein